MSLLERQCPVLRRRKVCVECPKAQQQWDLEKLLNDLAEQQTKPLTPTEQCWLMLLLQGLCPMQIAKLLKYKQNLRSELSKSIYGYVASLTGREKISDWAQVRLYLELAGYRRSILPDEAIEIQIRISRSMDTESINRLFSELKQMCGSSSLSLEGSYKE